MSNSHLTNCRRYKRVMIIENKKTWLGIFSLIAIEQFIKIIIYNNYLNERFDILPPILYFEPIFNRRYSWFNSMLQLGNGKWLHIVLVSIMTLILYLFYQYLKNSIGNSNFINIMFAFLFSGAICSLIDKVFWDGSLDYILVNGLFTFDLKDVYINIFTGLMILSLFLNNKTISQINEKATIREFKKFIIEKYKFRMYFR